MSSEITVKNTDLVEGLLNKNKSIPSKYFYDVLGDELFTKIMQLPEYYLSRAEFEIFDRHKNELFACCEIVATKNFELVELGAGDGRKTRVLLQYLLEEGYDFTYVPVDISQNVLNVLQKNVNDLKGLKIAPQCGDYFDLLEKWKDNKSQKIVLFLGSNLGNMNDDLAAKFIGNIAEKLKKEDRLWLGLDLKKDGSIVLPAYNDKSGITKEFNLNLLRRINREMGADFNLNKFTHSPEYLKDGRAVSYLESEEDQRVYIAEIDTTIFFKKGEKILTEISRKYDQDLLYNLISKTNLKIQKQFSDGEDLFSDFVLGLDV
jgi:L-histidine N-alpha-methyltransferase